MTLSVVFMMVIVAVIEALTVGAVIAIGMILIRAWLEERKKVME